ncbi:MAG: CBS domain-containing protein [Hyphomicrobiales bacterium]|nr:CBS domain-containing protein [Hyphomicrobiales bacterium]
MQAKDIMTTSVITVAGTMSVRDAATLMIENKISALPVVDAEGKLLGIVSEGDFLRTLQTPQERTKSWWLRIFQSSEDAATDYIKSHARFVHEVMTKKVLTINETDDISHIAAVLEKNRIKRVPVVTNGKVVGIVSRGNLMQAVAAQSDITSSTTADKEIRDSIMKQLDEAVPNAHLIGVVVRDGVVTLMGSVDTEKEKEAVTVAVENVSGYKSVEDNIFVSSIATTAGWA